jgi:predicted secreted hydrolase
MIARRGGRRVLIPVMVAVLASVACDGAPEPRATLSAAALLADGDTAGFARADAPRQFVFPADHGPHPDYRHEWWYFTGNLAAASGDRYGFQLTFFRSALRPDDPEVDSPWATNQIWMAHFALTDVAGQTFHAFERFERGAMGLAGAQAQPFRVHVGEWEASLHPAPPPDVGDMGGRPAQPAATPPQAAPHLHSPTSPNGHGPLPPIRLLAGQDPVALDLVLEPLKAAVFQGENGWSRKGPEPGNASYYYSLTRMAARGTVTVGGRTVEVEGLSWLDREWGTSALGPELDGWDWFSVQLDDGTELMFFQLRRQDGARDPLDSGTFVHSDGRTTRLFADDVQVQPTGQWRSPRGGTYPSGWRLAVPRLDLTLELEPLLRDQELDLTFRYWEGAVAARGNREGRAVAGHGYVELTGYAQGERMR